MTDQRSRVTIHMAASLDGFIAREDGSVDWMETADEFPAGETMTPEYTAAFLASIDCYLMGARTYETALGFESKGLGWAYGDTPTWVLTHHTRAKTRESVRFCSGDLRHLVNDRLRPRYRNIWIAGGGEVAGQCLQLGLVDEVRYSILPVVLGAGIPFFRGLLQDVALHLEEVKTYRDGIVALRHSVRQPAL
jgi:dihydrofolate reductase